MCAGNHSSRLKHERPGKAGGDTSIVSFGGSKLPLNSLMAACLFLSLWLISTPSSAGRLQDVFTIANVSVDETAQTAAIARATAIQHGQREAINTLFERLVMRADDELLPLLPETEVTALVQGFEVANEKTSSRRYLANLTFKFKKQEVRSLLKREGIPFTETIAKPTLVLPVFAFGGTRVLWDDPNPWRQAWAVRARMDTGLLPFVVPFGDLEDLTTIDADQAIEGDEAALQRMARRYQAEEVLVAHAAVSFQGGGDAPTVQVVLRRFGPLGERVIVEQFDGQRGDQIPDLLQGVANVVTIDLEEEWKALTLLDFGTKFALDARVPLTGLQDWLTVRRVLKESAVVQKSRLTALTVDEAKINVEFVGASQGLVVALAQRDLDLVYNENLWTLSLRKEQVIENAISSEGEGAADSEMLKRSLDELLNQGSQSHDTIPDDEIYGSVVGQQTIGEDPASPDDLQYPTGEIEWQLEGENQRLDQDENGLHPSIQVGDGFSRDSPAILVPLPPAGIDGGFGADHGNSGEERGDGLP